MIVMLHTDVIPPAIQPILTLAVPLFFMMTSYFFFLKIVDLNEIEKKSALKKYVLRNAKLYAFYFVLLFPTFVIDRNWFEAGFMIGFVKMLRGILLSGTFGGSWFITAAVTDVVLVYCLSKKMSDKWICLISLTAFLICCIDSNYCRLIFSNEVLEKAYYQSHQFFTYPRYTFPAGMLWVSLGKSLASNPVFMKRSIISILCWFSLPFLFIEDTVVRYMQWPSDGNTCYLSFIPICLCFFVWFGVSDFKVAGSALLRKMSTMIYCMHLSIIFWLRELTACGNYVVFVIAMLVSTIISLIIIRMQKYPKLNWLKYAY